MKKKTKQEMKKKTKQEMKKKNKQALSKAGSHPHKRPPIRRKTIAILLRKTTIASPVGAQAPLAIPKLWRSYSVASYIPSTLRGEGLGESGGALLMKEGRGGWEKTSHDGQSKNHPHDGAVGKTSTGQSENHPHVGAVGKPRLGSRKKTFLKT